jgi:hypothetical protein
MTKKKSFILTMVITLITLFSLAKYIPARPSTEHSRNLIDLKQAYNLALESVKKENSKAILYFITSADEVNQTDFEQGRDGRRNLWNIDFVVPDSEQHYVVSIKDGKVVKCESVKSAIDQNRLYLDVKHLPDTNKVINNVINKYDINPGRNWAFGYHFSYSKQNDKSVLIITGADNDGSIAKILVDASTEEVLSFNHKVLTGGGFYKNGTKISLPNDTSYSVFGSAKTTNNTNDGLIIWGRLHYNLINSEPMALITNNDGKQWTSLNLSGNPIKIWYSDDNSLIYAALDNGVFTSSDFGKSWSSILDVTIENADAVSSSAKNIAILSSENIYLSEDGGNTWIKDNSITGATEIDTSKYGTFLLKNNELYKRKNLQWCKIDTPVIQDIYRFKSYSEGIMLYNSTDIYFSKDEEIKWNSLNISEGIKDIFTNNSETKDNLIYVLSEENKLCKLIGGDSIKYTDIKMTLPQGGDLVDLTLGQNDSLYYSMIPMQVWEIISKEK